LDTSTMESSLPGSELELETRSAISMRAETNPGLFSWLLDYGRSCETFFPRWSPYQGSVDGT
jgi:hypothetical protein